MRFKIFHIRKWHCSTYFYIFIYKIKMYLTPRLTFLLILSSCIKTLIFLEQHKFNFSKFKKYIYIYSVFFIEESLNKCIILDS